jgi:hypothetical protein
MDPAKPAAKTPRPAWAWLFVRALTIGKFRGMHNREQTMKHFAFVIGALALGLAAATPARADYAVVR